MKKVKEPAPHEKAAQIEKEAVRALSVDEIEEALTKSTYGGDDDLKKRLTEAGQTIYELRKDVEILKTECLALKEDNKKHLREIDDYKKTISKMKYAHEEEVRALEDELAEAKVLGKKAGEYSAMLDADSDTFEKILDLTDSLKCQVHAMRGVLGLIGSEVEGKI